MENVKPGGAYAGIRALDFSEGVAGSVTAMLLADFGADVVRIEPMGGGRLAGSPGHLAFNRGKKILAQDLDSETGLAIARKLLAGADVALFDKAPSEMQASVFSADIIGQEFPSLIHTWFPPYGTKGRWRDLPARHSLLAALSGYCWRQGAESEVPVDLVVPFVWYGQGVLGASMIGAALHERARSGLGQSLVVSGLHAFSQTGEPVPLFSCIARSDSPDGKNCT